MELRIYRNDGHAPVRRIDECGSGSLLQILAGSGVLDSRLVESLHRKEESLSAVVKRMVVGAAASVEAVCEKIGKHLGIHDRPSAAAPRRRWTRAVVDDDLEIHETRIARGDPRFHLGSNGVFGGETLHHERIACRDDRKGTLRPKHRRRKHARRNAHRNTDNCIRFHFIAFLM